MERLDIPVANVSVVLITTSHENFVDHMRALRPAPLSFVMPVWTESELSAIECWYPAAQPVWRERFRVLGGVPRYVMEDISEAPATILADACDECTFEGCTTIVSPYSELNAATAARQKLIHMTLDYQRWAVAYASKQVPRIIALSKWTQDAVDAMDHLQMASRALIR